MFAICNAVACVCHYKFVNYPKNGITKMQLYAKFFLLLFFEGSVSSVFKDEIYP